jgi:hypothetical protein
VSVIPVDGRLRRCCIVSVNGREPGAWGCGSCGEWLAFRDGWWTTEIGTPYDSKRMRENEPWPAPRSKPGTS